jgi:prolyl-tRNA synthetase
MRQSQLFTKTRKDAPSDEVSRNAQLLIRAGYVNKEMAGVYAYLPLGLRVIDNIKQIVREEMNKVGGQEIIMTSLQPKEVWEQTNRWSDEVVDVWFKSELKNGTPVGFGWSHEEPITEMMKQYIKSYRDLPAYIYQFQTKMRNELRAKSGIMRGREFVMKDMYTYDVDAESHTKIYNAIKDAYMKVFERVGLGDRTYITFAAGGAFTKFSHEFQTICEAGEDNIYVNRDKGIAINEEVMNDEVCKELGVSKDELELVKSAEVGNIFNFGTSKCDDMDFHITDENGHKASVYLGSYGIGITRLMGVLAEVFSDERGLVWPNSVAPFSLHLVTLAKSNDEESYALSQNIYDELTKSGVEVLWDDRVGVSAGEKFADSDLLGMPMRVTVSGKSIENGGVEIKERTAQNGEVITVNQLKTMYTKVC